MDPLAKQLRELPQRVSGLPRGVRIGALGALLVGLVAGAMLWSGQGDRWQYAFTNLAGEDSAEVAATLKGAGLPFRLEAGGTALAVPAEKVYDARLLLAAAGLPRGGGAGFELFDRGDLGVSEFTQKVNLRRALEGELARTIGHLANVRSARVHLTLAEKGLYRDDEHRAAAAVVLQLQPGRTLDERGVSGIRHLVASSVPGLAPDTVTIVDGRGSVLSAESLWGEAEAFRQRELEKSLEARLIGLLEPVVGPGAVVARVSATIDGTELSTSKETLDPQGVVRTEHKVTQTASQDSGGAGTGGGVAGAAANQPGAPQPVPAPAAPKSTSGTQDETRNFEVGRTVQRSVTKGFRVTRLSVALLVDGLNGTPRSAEELQQLAELARKAMGFDGARGDQLEISSAVFTRSTEPEPAVVVEPGRLPVPPWAGPAALGAFGLLVLVLLGRAVGRSGAREPVVLKAGESVAALEAALGGAPPPGATGSEQPVPFNAPLDPNLSVRDRARELVTSDPNRAALLLRAWISDDEVPHAAA